MPREATIQEVFSTAVVGKRLSECNLHLDHGANEIILLRESGIACPISKCLNWWENGIELI